MQYKIHRNKVKESLEKLEKSQIKGALECLKNYEQWVSHLEKSRLGMEAQFLGFSKWQKDFSSNNGQRHLISKKFFLYSQF